VHLSFKTAIPFSGVYLEDISSQVEITHYSTVCNSKVLETTQMPIPRRLVRETILFRIGFEVKAFYV
jgi:hypothetical protein